MFWFFLFCWSLKDVFNLLLFLLVCVSGFHAFCGCCFCLLFLVLFLCFKDLMLMALE